MGAKAADKMLTQGIKIGAQEALEIGESTSLRIGDKYNPARVHQGAGSSLKTVVKIPGDR